MSNKILNKVNDDTFSYDTTGGVFKMPRVNITDATPAKATMDFTDGSINAREASLMVEGGVIVKAGPTLGGNVGENPKIYSFISEGDGFFRGGLELENGITLLNGNNPINVCNINASIDGDDGGILEMFTKDINGNLTKKISINSTGSIGIGASPSYGNVGYVLTSNGSGDSPIWAAPLTAGTGVSIISDAISIGQSVATTDDVTFGKVTAKNLELNDNNGIKLTIEGDTGDVTCHGTLSIDAITKKGTTGIAIENCSINGNTISALNYKCGSRTIVDASAGCSFTALEIKPSTSGASETLLIDSNGDITCHGTLSIDTISEKSTGSGITLSSAVKMTAIQSGTNNNKLLYNSTTGEITYQTDTSSTSSGSHLSGLTDTNLSNLQDGDILEYNSATSQWINNGDIKTLLDSTNYNFLKITTATPSSYTSFNNTIQNLSLQFDFDFRTATLASGSYPQTMTFQSSPLTAYYTEESGTRNNNPYGTHIYYPTDSGEYLYTATYASGPTLDTTNNSSNTGILTNTKYYLSLPTSNLNITTEHSWEIYFRFQDVNSSWYTPILGLWDGPIPHSGSDGYVQSSSINIQEGNGSLAYDIAVTQQGGVGAPVYSGNDELNTDQWIHMVIVQKNSNAREYYVNGTQIANFTGGTMPNLGTRNKMILGRTEHTFETFRGDGGYDSQASVRPMNTRFVRFYGQVLTQTNVTTLYDNRDVMHTAAPAIDASLNNVNITDTTPATITIDYNDGSITDRHASLIVEGGVIVKAGPTSDDTTGSNPRVYSFISEGEGFFRGGLELENGMTLLSGNNPINVCNINAGIDGDDGGILEMFTKDINGNLTKKISINSTGSVGIGTSPSYGNSGDVLTSQGGGAPPIWAAPEASGGDTTSNSQIIKEGVETSSQYWGNPSWYESETNILAYYDFTKTAGWLGTGTAVDMGPNKNDITYVADFGTVEIITHGCIYDLNATNYVSGSTWTDSVGNKQVSLGANIQHYCTGTKHYFDIPFADFMTITNHFKLGYTFTIEIILRPHATNGWHQIFTGEGYRGASYTGFAIWLNGAILELYHHPNSTDVNDVTLIGQFGTLSNDTWAHLVVAKDITGYHVYINGSSAGTSTTMATANYDSPNHQIGYPYPTNGGNYGFDGDIAVFRVYGNKMSTTEVTSQYVEYSTSEGGWGTSASSPVSFLATNHIRSDMKLTLGSTYTGTIAMGCWVKLFHGSHGYSTNFPNKDSRWSGIMAYGNTENNGHFFCRGGIARFLSGGGSVDQNMWDFGIGCESIGQDTWSSSSIGSQKVWDYITAQPDYQNRWWCWQARLTADGRLETSLDGAPFAIAQQAYGTEDLTTIDLINSNNTTTLPEIRIGADGHLDNVANNSYGAMFWYRTSEYTDDMALDFYNTFKDKFKPAVSRSNILAYYNQVASPLSGATLTDLGPHGNDGTVSGAVAAYDDSLEWTDTGQIDTGITFQNILDSNGTGEFTVAAKFQYAGTDSQIFAPIFGSDAEGDTNFFIGKNSGNTDLGLADGPGSYQQAFITSPGIFDITGRASSHTIVVTREGTPGSYVIRVYIDGVYGNKMDYVGMSPLSHKILIGYEAGTPDFTFSGKIWQAIVLDKVLPSGEIQALHRVMTEDGQYLPLGPPTTTVQFYSPTGIAIDSDLSVWNENNPTTYSSGNDGDVLTSQGLGKPPKWEPMSSSRPYANLVNLAGGQGIQLNVGLTDLPFDQAVLSYGINLETAGGLFFTVENSGVYVCNVSFRGGGPDSWQTMYLRDSYNNKIATSHAIGTTNSIEAGYFVMARLKPGTSYKFTIERQSSTTTLLEGMPFGYQINCTIHLV